ncbi:phosphoenolpyruvate--protein phosphotransferase [Lysobacter sp. A03]|uniref:phosphoenolpyruvate--protein phosphotransferase n=1 Tax=Lysobacter sp. A03 TaxID=1199154 RepID=UPI0005B74C42|nr:phosphoenolpyruvate--protein phosphotransferase [Lysobacter sp. A03]KIQ97313.1 Phosphoenolpyruvate-protein phosphotransferase of PTS system [Lysobacter sp. A03]
MRQELSGLAASRGSALGRARVRLPHVVDVVAEYIDPAGVDAELARLHDAIDRVRTEMHAMRDRLQGALAHEVGEFLDLHALLLDDPELLHGLDELIRTDHSSADYALRQQRDRIAAVFARMDDDYFRSRMDDIDQVIARVHASLHRRLHDTTGVAGEILVTDNVAPAELAQLQEQGVVAIVTSSGSVLSHSAILARSLHLPMVVGVPGLLQRVNDGDALIVDGGAGTVVIEPRAPDLRNHRAQLRAQSRDQRELNRLRSQPNRSRDDVSIEVHANAESREDVAEAHALGATGIGLYRTEFLFLRSNELPDEQEQFHAYRDVVLGMSGRPVTIRTLDLGADKADRTGLALRDEPNPAMGVRGIRLSLARTGLLETQLRAILRASGYGPVRILLPMVTTREEVRTVRAELERISAALRSEGHEIAPHVPLGTMIEVPAAAIALSGFISEIDFVAIGTNDLIQYLLAADRNNDALGELHTLLHPAVLRVMRDVLLLAKKHAIPASVCGEIAGDARFSPLLLALGLEQFSVHPSSLLEVRRTIRSCDVQALRARAPALMRARDRAQIEQWMARQAAG